MPPGGTTARGCRSAVKGGGAGRYHPGAPSDHPHSPRPARRGVHMWYVGAVGTTARANPLMLIVPNSSSPYTLFYSVIYNSVVASSDN